MRIALLACILALWCGCATTQNAPMKVRAVPVGDAAHAGNPSSPIQLTVFIDFGNPQMESCFTTLDQLIATSEEEFFIVYKHRPRLRGNADQRALHRQSAIAAIAATRQNAFPRFLAHLRARAEQKNPPSSDVLLEGARRAGLDMERFHRDLSDPLIPAQLSADDAVAMDWNAGQSPQILLNGRVISSRLSDARAALKDEWRHVNILRQWVPDRHISAYLSEFNRHVRAPKPPQAAPAAARRVHPVLWSPEHLVLGAPEKDTLVTLVVFTDYACPFCLRHENSLRTLLQRHPKDLRVVFRHHPLERHPAARDIASAAMAAHALGRGEAYHARLTTGERSMIPGPPEEARLRLVSLAEELGLSKTEFQNAMQRLAGRVQEDFLESRDRLGISGTPHTFVNGRKIKGAVSLSIFEQAIKDARTQARKISEKRGLTGKALYRFLVGASGTPR